MKGEKVDWFELYRQRKITRAELIAKGYSPKSIWSILSRRGIKVWDTNKLDAGTIDAIIRDYRNGITREKIAKRYGLEMWRINSLLYKKGIELWDNKKLRKQKKRESKYFNWDELKYHYMVYNK